MARPRTRRRERRSVPQGNAFIYSTFNNTLVSLTDPQGNVISSASAGTVGFKGYSSMSPVLSVEPGCGDGLAPVCTGTQLLFSARHRARAHAPDPAREWKVE